MKLITETTDWSGNIPNHTYVFDDSANKISGYIPFGTKLVKRFRVPIGFDKRRRTFIPAKAKDFDFSEYHTT